MISEVPYITHTGTEIISKEQQLSNELHRFFILKFKER